MCMWMKPPPPGVHRKKRGDLFIPAHSPRKREWAASGSAEASLRAAGDGRQEPAAGSRPGRSIGELAGSAQPDGFERRLFSPRSA